MGAVEEATPAKYQPVFETNVFGLIETRRAALPALRWRKGARVVNFFSDAAISSAAGYGCYNATRFAVEDLSEALAQELAPLGLRVIIAYAIAEKKLEAFAKDMAAWRARAIATDFSRASGSGEVPT